MTGVVALIKSRASLGHKDTSLGGDCEGRGSKRGEAVGCDNGLCREYAAAGVGKGYGHQKVTKEQGMYRTWVGTICKVTWVW